MVPALFFALVIALVQLWLVHGSFSVLEHRSSIWLVGGVGVFSTLVAAAIWAFDNGADGLTQATVFIAVYLAVLAAGLVGLSLQALRAKAT